MRLSFLAVSFFFIIKTSPAQQTVGLFLNTPDSWNGYTLVAPSSSDTTYLIDNCGRVVHRWTSLYPPGQTAYLLDDGRLLRPAVIPNQFNVGGTGGRLEMYNWEGDLIWAWNLSADSIQQHHDVCYLPNGNILALAWERKTKEQAIDAGRNPFFVGNNGAWSEVVFEIQPVGFDSAAIVWEWRLWDHLVQRYDSTKANYGFIKDHPERLNINFNAYANVPDWIHLNSIDYNPDLDQIILSSRNLSEFWIIDHSTTSAEAAGSTGGNSGKGGDFLYRWGNPLAYNRGTTADKRLWGQHNVHWIPPGRPDAGKIMLFNNGQGRPDGNYSSVDILTPPFDGLEYTLAPDAKYGPDSAEWSYSAVPPASFYSNIISGAQRLPNGNTLICEGRNGELFEIDTAFNKVWDYITPVKNGVPVEQGVVTNNNSVFRALRYDPDYPAFAGKDLQPGAPIELNPLPSDCVLFSSAGEAVAPGPGCTIHPNPAAAAVTISMPEAAGYDIRITDLLGNTLLKTSFSGITATMNTESWPAGLYFVAVSKSGNIRKSVKTLIKM